ncbi:ABC transporter permease subunit [Mycobacterium sp. KBS0706]|jgi:oligopeptide transport system permease protein|uniref:ABC transporter permease subunit n=1 Tax=Mycobacterium sp. KBS0706 TaxID=2578109 RepID=UPI00110FE7CF|nr:ABC transporter permease subunit [Mycobacterium sp. KBS0706]TSD88020.1 ABC transporter permease subunit [Mycobacterium sp. KBS0706]
MTDATIGTLPPPAAKPIKGRSLWQDAWRRLRGNKAAIASVAVLALIAIACIVGPYLLPWGLDEVDYTAFTAPPSFAAADDGTAAHYFGTEANGRDLLVRTLYGGQISLMVGIVGTLVSLIIGVAYGATSGFLGGRVDSMMMRVVDVLYSLPFMFFVILLMVFFGRHIFLIFVAIGAVNWLDMARIVRGQTLSIKRKEYIEAAHACGVSSWGIIRKHVIPNTLGPVIVYMSLTVPQVILLESFLSFLGLGVQEPMTSWGVLISEGARSMTIAWWMLVFPAVFLAVTLFCLNFIGDGLRDALDPRDR